MWLRLYVPVNNFSVMTGCYIFSSINVDKCTTISVSKTFRSDFSPSRSQGRAFIRISILYIIENTG